MTPEEALNLEEIKALLLNPMGVGWSSIFEQALLVRSKTSGEGVEGLRDFGTKSIVVGVH